jgi:hypothetical protein
VKAQTSAALDALRRTGLLEVETEHSRGGRTQRVD